MNTTEMIIMISSIVGAVVLICFFAMYYDVAGIRKILKENQTSQLEINKLLKDILEQEKQNKAPVGSQGAYKQQ